MLLQRSVYIPYKYTDIHLFLVYNEFLLCIQNFISVWLTLTELTETGDLLLIFRLIIFLYSDSHRGTWASGDTHKVYYLQLYIIYF